MGFYVFFVLSFHFPSSSCLPSRWDRSFPLPAMYATTKVRTALTRTTTSEDRLFGVRSTTGGPTTQKPVFSRTRLPRFACASLWDGRARAVERNLGAFGKILRCDFFNVVAHEPRFTYARGRVKSGSLCLCSGVGGVLCRWEDPFSKKLRSSSCLMGISCLELCFEPDFLSFVAGMKFMLRFERN